MRLRRRRGSGLDRRSAGLRSLLAVVVLAGCLAGAGSMPAAAQESSRVPVIELDGTVDPATERWLDHALDEAEHERAPLAIIRLDTPGGLDASMRSMVKRLIDSPVPVVVYVAPDGARAASAGLFLLQAADVAAMAPQTNTGSATPVQLGGEETDEVLGRKIQNDAAAYVRALAAGHGRNAELAERMVREATNVPAKRARERGLIDVVAADDRALLRALEGFKVQGPKARTLRTEALQIDNREMPFAFEAIQLLVNPTVASLLLLAGVAGLAIELLAPGGMAAGVLGAIALVLGLYGTAQLPVTAAGIALLGLGLILLVAETQVASGGVLGVGGVGALVAGLLLLYRTDSEVYAVSAPAALAAGAALGSLTLFAAKKGLSTRRRPARTGGVDLIGRRAVVRSELNPQGQVFVGGSLWRAKTSNPELVVPAGEWVEVRELEGLTLSVDVLQNNNGGGRS